MRSADREYMQARKAFFVERCDHAGAVGLGCLERTLREDERRRREIHEELCPPDAGMDGSAASECAQRSGPPRLALFVWHPTVRCLQEAVVARAVEQQVVDQLLKELIARPPKTDQRGEAPLPAQFAYLSVDGRYRPVSLGDRLGIYLRVTVPIRHDNQAGYLLSSGPLPDDLATVANCAGGAIRIGDIDFNVGRKRSPRWVELGFSCH